MGAADVGLRGLTRQRELVQGIFGDWRLARRPLLVATQTNETVFKSLQQQVQGTDFLLLRAGADVLQQCNDPLKTVEIAALWPFELKNLRPDYWLSLLISSANASEYFVC